MQTKISETTAVGGYGVPTGKKLLKVHSGKYAGRMIAVYKTSDSEIKYSFSNSPYDKWSTLTTIVSDSSNNVIDIAINERGDVYIVYCEISTNYLVSIKLTINDIDWTIGSKVDVYNAELTNTPSITIDTSGKLYVSFSVYNINVFDLQVKTSVDDGLTWGISPSDIGETIATGLIMILSKIMISDNNVHVVYVTDWNAIKERSRQLSGNTWTSEFVLVSSINIDTHFDATVLPGGFIGVVYDNTQLNYREFDGSNWSPITLLDSSEAFYPQVTLINKIPVVLYLTELHPGEFLLKQTNRLTGSFSTPTLMEKRTSTFDSVVLYDNNSSTYEDKTLEASNAVSGDMYHSISTVLCHVAGDKIYCGSDLKFRFIHMVLSSAGIGGLISYAYFDGSNWKSFTPSSGLFHLDSADKELILWDDFDSAPIDWQKNYINGDHRFWIKIEVTTGFVSPPIGSQFTSISNLNSISVRR